MFDIFKKKTASRVITTLTDELYLPTRVYYKIHNTLLLKKTLRKLKCIQFVEENSNCFTIFYCKEAKKLNLATHYQDVEREFYPIPLADCCITVNSILHVDTESLRRAVELIHFLVKNIPYNIIEITSFAHMNKAFTAREDEEFKGLSLQDYNNAFDNIISDDDRGLYDKLKELAIPDHLTTEQAENLKTEVLKLILSFVEADEQKNYPDAEKISIKYSRANHHNIINTLAFRAVIKENVAYKRFEGYKNYTSLDAIKELIDRIEASKI